MICIGGNQQILQGDGYLNYSYPHSFKNILYAGSFIVMKMGGNSVKLRYYTNTDHVYIRSYSLYEVTNISCAFRYLTSRISSANASVRKSYNIKRFDDEGGLRPVSEQIEMNIIPLDELYELEEFHYKAMEDTAKQEKDNDITLIKEQTTLQSTQRSIQASGGIPKYSSSLPEKTEINSLSQEKTLSELIAEKGYHVQYLGWDHIGYLFSTRKRQDTNNITVKGKITNVLVSVL